MQTLPAHMGIQGQPQTCKLPFMPYESTESNVQENRISLGGNMEVHGSEIVVHDAKDYWIPHAIRESILKAYPDFRDPGKMIKAYIRFLKQHGELRAFDRYEFRLTKDLEHYKNNHDITVLGKTRWEQSSYYAMAVKR